MAQTGNKTMPPARRPFQSRRKVLYYKRGMVVIKQERRIHMEYRELGRTGYRVSRLGFGAMRLPMIGDGEKAHVDREKAIPMIHRAFDLGINYIDTARGYCNEDSQRAVGEALEGRRNGIVVSTKNPYFGKDEKVWWTNLENSLKRLRVDAIDIYNFHGISWKIFTEDIEPRVGAWMQKAYDQGLVRHICMSFHDTVESLVKLVDTGRFESVTLQYNLIDRRLEDGIAHAREKGLGVVVMGPVGGGRLAEPSGILGTMVDGRARVPELALRFVLANPDVTVALSGMSEIRHVEENVAIAEDTAVLSKSELDEMDGHLVSLKKMADLYCTGCGYCMPCPQGVNIPRIFQLYNQVRVYDIRETSREAYGQIGRVEWEPGKPADSCVECGQCEPQCPQNIPIIRQLAEAHRILTE